MENNIEKDVKNACEDMTLRELSEYLENTDMPEISEDSKSRIKAMVSQKMPKSSNENKKISGGTKVHSGRKFNKSIIRLATVAAAFVLVVSGAFMLNTDSVKASLAKLFGFVPGVGVVEVPVVENTESSNENGWYILERANYVQQNDMAKVEIQNANMTGNVFTVNYTVDLLNISIAELENLSVNLSENSFRDYADLYRDKGYEAYFEIKDSADTLTPLSSVKLCGTDLNLMDRKVLSGESLEGAKLICISERYAVENTDVAINPDGSLTIGGLEVEFSMKNLETYILDESAEQNGEICTANGMKLLCVPMWEEERLYLDFYTLESGEYDRLGGFGMGYWPVVTVNGTEVETFADESYVFDTKETGCFGRRVYCDLSGVEGEFETVEISLEGVMAVEEDDSAILDVSVLDTVNEKELTFSQTASMTRTDVLFVGLEEYRDEDEFLYSEYGNVLVSYRLNEKCEDAVFAGFEKISINGVEQDIWAEGYNEMYFKLPCAFEELREIKGEGAVYFVYRQFDFTIQK